MATLVAEGSRRSSITLMEHKNNPPAASVGPSPLDREIAQDELEFEIYGGNDIHDPPSKEVASITPTPTFTEPAQDPNRVFWNGANDLENPQNWSVRRKWGITAVCIMMTVNVTFASSAPTAATHAVIATFGISAEVSYLMTTTFLLGYVFGPLFWGPGSELWGRRPIFLIAMISYTVLHLGQALAKNIETLLVTRFLSGFFAVAPMTNCGGVIADIWSAETRGLATSLFTASVFMGPVMGPIVAGYIVESSLSWRWVFWVMMMFAGACTLLMIILLPETYAPVLLQKRARRLRKADPEKNHAIYAEHERSDWSFKGVLHRTLFRPFKMLAMEPILLLVTFYVSIVYAILYALFQAFPIIFVSKRGFTIAQDGLIFIGIGIGTSLGSLINVFTSRHYPALIAKWKGFPPPEERLYGAMIGGPCLVVGIFWLGWTGEYSSIPWYVPALSSLFLGTSISLIFISFLSYLVDTYLMYSASAFAANTMCRSAAAAAFPLFTVQMFTKMGVNWACTLFGILGLILAPSPFLFKKYGPRIRAHSKFAPCIDLRIAKELEAEALAKEEKV
ncbi:hypothetical protein PTI98_012879 [Pleurotus ostreatus]|nr:hypothetical protein PTI98_012879 [Pleurotus ostreatus]